LEVRGSEEEDAERRTSNIERPTSNGKKKEEEGEIVDRRPQFPNDDGWTFRSYDDSSSCQWRAFAMRITRRGLLVGG
jgi:hypothetical protein